MSKVRITWQTKPELTDRTTEGVVVTESERPETRTWKTSDYFIGSVPRRSVLDRIAGWLGGTDNIADPVRRRFGDSNTLTLTLPPPGFITRKLFMYPAAFVWRKRVPRDWTRPLLSEQGISVIKHFSTVVIHWSSLNCCGSGARETRTDERLPLQQLVPAFWGLLLLQDVRRQAVVEESVPAAAAYDLPVSVCVV